jgi:hypothetical protein
MKAILEFDLNDFENDDRSQFQDAVDGPKWKMAMWDLDQWLRAQYKYMPDNEYSKEAYEAYEKSREQLYLILNEAGLKLD